ncbi:Ppx/GppA phosphatase family protein [Rhodohalobacter sp. SW132]|nr:Ppx/GppA phosphatase family protein [Rhodohalobacter sp. SW132]
MIRASIDIGTNSVLLLVAELKNGEVTVIREEQRIPRLGKGVDLNGNLSLSAQERVLANLEEYRQILEHHYPETSEQVIVTATSAVRDASNRKEFMDAIRKQTGWETVLLSGDDEARTTYSGALAVLPGDESGIPCTVLDIGGGSTEFASGIGTALYDWKSLDMGSVRFTERFLKSNPPSKAEVERASEAAGKMLETWQPNPQKITKLIGVAGTVTSMAGIHLNLQEYDIDRINGHTLPLEYVKEMIGVFCTMETEKIEKKYPVFLTGRADVITGGLIILAKVMDYFSVGEITVSTGGIRHGILLDPKFME